MKITFKISTKILLLFLLVLISGKSNSQQIFKIETFNNNSANTKFDTIAVSQKIDLFFYRKHFQIPYFFSEKLIDSNHENETVVKWNSDDFEKDYHKNWTHSYTYDEFSRVIKYEYSGCFVCSQLPYQVEIKYDTQNQPVELIQSYKTIDSPSFIHYKIEYNSNHYIKSLEKFENTILTKKIELVN
ncbi:MAG: hypothetical protein WCY16_01380 [Weeksellaceae bacterium]